MKCEFCYSFNQETFSPLFPEYKACTDEALKEKREKQHQGKIFIFKVYKPEEKDYLFFNITSIIKQINENFLDAYPFMKAKVPSLRFDNFAELNSLIEIQVEDYLKNNKLLPNFEYKALFEEVW